MIVKNLHQPFEIVYKEMDECPLGPHRHNFFELIYILDGSGRQCTNKNELSYRAGQLFLVTPKDCHSFKVDSTTKFVMIRFSDIYLRSQQNGLGGDAAGWIQKLEFIFNNIPSSPGCILTNPGDKILVRSLIDGLLREEVNRELYHQELIQQVINTILTIVVRNLSLAVPGKMKMVADSPAVSIVQYIQHNIYSPEKLRVEKMAAYFDLGLNYFSEYFKKHTGEGLQQYITSYKMKLVETRLLHSDLRIGEIANELGFTDESHLNRIFKKYRGQSPSSFRKSKLAGSIASKKQAAATS